MKRRWHLLSDLPDIYDVIWCRIPYRETPGVPGPLHPCIVRDIERNDALGEAIVHVTRGTSNLKKETRWDLDLIVEHPRELAACGLEEPTRFDLDDAQHKVPCDWDNIFFPDPKPVGKLNLDCIRRMNNRLRGWNPVPDDWKPKPKK
jgi:hypothetical protein